MKRNLMALAVAAMLLPSVARSADEPRIVRENIEWCDIWITGAGDTKLPRVLMIGDSITRAYYGKVEKLVGDKAACARLATSKSLGDPALLAEVALVAGQYPWAVIHFNNGMHGWGYSEEEYKKAFPELLATIRKSAPHAKLIWASTTPVRVHDKIEELDARTQRVRARNQIAADFIVKENIPIDDLFGLVENHPEYSSNDGVHFNDKGSSAQAEQVAAKILEALK